MSDISTVWQRDLGRGDWSLESVVTSRTPIAVAAATLFAMGDGTTTKFPLAGGVIDTVAATIYRSDWQGNQLLYATPRTNGIIWSEGTVAQLYVSGNVTNGSALVSATSGSIQFGDNSLARYAYRYFTPTLGLVYTFSAFIVMDDGGAPAPSSSNTSGDFCAVFENDVRIAPIVTALGGGLYRLVGTYTSIYGLTTKSNVGIIKFAGQSARGFRVQCYQIEIGSVATSYIKTAAAAVTLTDYSISSAGAVTFGVAPLAGAALAWLGSYVRATVSDGGYLQNGNDLESAILISLFSDRQALSDDVIPDGSGDPRGWVGDLDSDYPIGSRLWLLSRSKQNAETLQHANDYIAEAIQWLIDDGVVAGFGITVEWTKSSMLGALVTAYKDNTAAAPMKFSWVWKEIN